VKKALILCVLLLFSCEKKSSTQAPEIPVKVTSVIKKDAPLYVDTIGHVEPIITVNIVSRVRGELTGVYFKEGDWIKKGDLLFTIDPRDHQATLDKANAVKEETLARLKFAEEKLVRYSGLTKEEYFSQIDYDQFKTDAATLSATVKENQADIDYAAINLDYCWLYSPLEGRTGILQITLGNMLKDDESQTLVTVNQMKPIYVTFSVPERELPHIRKYHTQKPLETRVSFESLSQNFITGSLEMLDNEVDTKTGMVKLRATFTNDKEELWPGQFVRTRLILTIAKDSLLIPTQAVDITVNGKFVYVLKEDGTVDMRPVTLGQQQDDNIIVLNGLKEGETIVTEGLFNLFPGAKVKIANETAP
jgi:membrane fusion protein, multidrug efflux system